MVTRISQYMGGTGVDNRNKIFVDSTNTRFGVATTGLPDANLHVVGNTHITGNTHIGNFDLFANVNSGRIGIKTINPTHNLHVVGNTLVTANFVVGTNELYVDQSTGRVGIETIPVANLDISGNVVIRNGMSVSVPVTLSYVNSNQMNVDFYYGQIFEMTLTQATTVNNPSNHNLGIGGSGYLFIRQNAQGGWNVSTWGSSWKFSNVGFKPNLTAAGHSVAMITYYVANTNFIACTFTQGFA